MGDTVVEKKKTDVMSKFPVPPPPWIQPLKSSQAQKLSEDSPTPPRALVTSHEEMQDLLLPTIHIPIGQQQ